MSGMDRLTDELLEGMVQEGDAAPWVSEMARELLDHRRASQAAPAPKDNDVIWAAYYRDGLTLGEVAEKFGLTIYDLSPWLYRPLMRMPDPAPSDGLREALTDLYQCDEWGRFSFDEVKDRVRPLLAHLSASPAQEGGRVMDICGKCMGTGVAAPTEGEA